MQNIESRNKATYCLKCGTKLMEDSLDNFCDKECRKEYYAELAKDNNNLFRNMTMKG